jgi:type IV pilus assembly protein PilC
MLRRNGFIPVEVHEVVEKKFDASNIQIGVKRVKTAEMAFFTRQVSTMIRAGMSPLQALSVAQKGSSNAYLKDTLGEVKDSINAGASLSAAMGMHPKVFNNLYISLIQAGELGGVMPEALDRLADQMEKDNQMRKDIRGAMMYPMVVLIFAMCILTAMLLFVVPAFTAIFEGAGGKLPFLTQILVTASDIIRKFWFLLPVVIIGLRFGIKAILNTEGGPGMRSSSNAP